MESIVPAVGGATAATLLAAADSLPAEVLCNIDKYHTRIIKREFVLNQIPMSPVQANHTEFSTKLSAVCCYVAAINEIILENQDNFSFEDYGENISKFTVSQKQILKKTINIATAIGDTMIVDLGKSCISILKNYYKMVGWKIKVTRDKWEFIA